MKPQLLIGAASSGSGKTTFTMGLLRALKNRGLQIQPYKCGPDYIDTKFHTLASGHESVNLDTWLGTEDHVKQLYQSYGENADVCVVEGVMGLYDGYHRTQGSSAELAGLLDIPVILLVNAKSTAYSVAPLISGFKNFSSKVRIVGVVFNQVSSMSHFEYLKGACLDVGVECLGYIPFSKELKVPSRHLGLSFGAEKRMDEQMERVADLITRHVDIDRLLELCKSPFTSNRERSIEKGMMKIAVAKDEAFNFMYRENLEQLKRLGTVTFFSPLRDNHLPEADLIYLPGGYPELFAYRLQKRQQLMAALKEYAEKGGKILAECGGLIYLCSSLTNRMGDKLYQMSGVLPLDCTMVGARLHLGYRKMMLDGNEWRGHEFHYSNLKQSDVLPSMAVQVNAKGQEVNTSIYRYKNVIAGYTHWYWGNKNIMDLWKQ